jgi:dTDP-D-glucose 4,6-dehydratase
MVKKYPHYKIVNFDKLDYCACLDNLQEIDRYRNYKVSRLIAKILRVAVQRCL